jgi:hypothetical protein
MTKVNQISAKEKANFTTFIFSLFILILSVFVLIGTVLDIDLTIVQKFILLFIYPIIGKILTYPLVLLGKMTESICNEIFQEEITISSFIEKPNNNLLLVVTPWITLVILSVLLFIFVVLSIYKYAV